MNRVISLQLDGSSDHANTASANISRFSINNTCVLTPIDSTVEGTNPSGSFNLDLATSSDSKFLFAIDDAAGAISEFQIQSDGPRARTISVHDVQYL